MLAYHFSEMPYPFLPEDIEDRYGAMRVTLPNEYFDPQKRTRTIQPILG